MPNSRKNAKKEANLFMLPKNSSQLGFYSTYEKQLSRHYPLYKLTHVINRKGEKTFSKQDSAQHGQPDSMLQRNKYGTLAAKKVRFQFDQTLHSK